MFKAGVKNPHGKVAYSTLSKVEQLAYMREVNRRAYLKRVGTLKRRSPLVMTEELRLQYYRDKANLRATRAKKARFYDELTLFAVKEAHTLRKLRNKLTGFEWHVDHIVPLQGRIVSGLHIWSNLQVISKQANLQKGAYYSLHEKRAQGL